jgi:acyl dehydratase
MPAPKTDFKTPERYWEDAKVGDACESSAYLVTGERIDMYAELTGDFTPVHVNEEYARKSHFGQRVAHGLFGQSIADGLKTQCEYRFRPGLSLGWTWDFLLPIAINDTLHVKFRIGSMRESKSILDWGIVVIPTELINQKGQVVQKGEHRLMVPRRPTATQHSRGI